MTDQSNIDQKSAKRASLFERADAVFGLDRLGTASVPRNLPAGKAPPPRRGRTEEAAGQSMPLEKSSATAAAPVPARPVTFAGPFMEIDRDRLYREGLIQPEAPASGLLEEFRIVKRELLADARAGKGDIARRILVCSPHPGEGKTYCAMNLAIALAAERDVEVVLVDADVLNPSITRRLGIEAVKGLMNTLSNKALPPENCVSPTDIDGLFVMPAGTSGSRDSELLASTRTGEVLERLTRGAPNRFIIFDTPPALAASPAAELAAHVGQALLVVRADHTGRAALEDARQLLSACPDIKLLLNAAQFSPSGRRFGDYGEREEK